MNEPTKVVTTEAKPNCAPVTGSGASKREEILACLEASRQAKRIPWPDGIGVTMVAEYRHNVTGQIGCVVAADQDENEIELWLDQHNRWGGTIQDFQRDWSKHQNVRMSDAPQKPSDSPSACEARSTPCAGSGNPGITAARESQNKPGGERAEFPKPTN